MKIGILGFGNVGRKLAQLLEGADHELIVGVRDRAKVADAPYSAGSLDDAARLSEAVVIAVPYAACAALLPDLAGGLAGKIVIDATNPLNGDWSPLFLGEENSAGEEIARLLPGSRVVKAFNTVFADIMRQDRLDRDGLRTTAFICGDDATANAEVARLAQTIGFAPLITGPLRSARYLEAMAHLNIAIAVAQGGGTNAAFLYHQVKA